MEYRFAWLAVLALSVACGSGSSSPDPDGDDDQVVTDQDGDALPGDGDALPGDGDEVSGDGDELPGDGDALPQVCTPGSSEVCYDGPTDTLGVGACIAGSRTCNSAGDAYGSCQGQVVPIAEVCSNGIDDDCNGAADDSVDADGDGWTRCDGDCCDTLEECDNPALVNPGAYEFEGNGLDDDCDPATTTTVPCDASLASNPASTDDYARALGLCSFTTQGAPLATRTWGVLSTTLKLPSGTGAPAAASHAVRSAFGVNNTPQHGGAFVVLSTGVAAAVGQTDPAHVAPDPGYNQNTSAAPPADWYTANGNTITVAPGCPSPAIGTVYDPVVLELRVRVPTNAGGFTARFNFFSAEYPEWVCSPYNDVFVALLDSQASGNPTDKNIAKLVTSEPATYLVSASLAANDSGFFTQCTNGPTGCKSGAVAGTTSVCLATDGLTGTGLDTVTTTNNCSANNLVGGATGWLGLRGSVIPGETVTLRFAIWDTADYTLDSTVMLDDFQWTAVE